MAEVRIAVWDRFMQPLLGELVSTIKANAPAPSAAAGSSAVSAELAKAKRKLHQILEIQNILLVSRLGLVHGCAYLFLQ